MIRSPPKNGSAAKRVKQAPKASKPSTQYPLYRPVTVNMGKQAFPKQLRSTLRYADTFNLVSTTGAYAQYLFSANGLYDPNVSGVGHQPRAFDQLMAIYNHYTVVASRITVTLMPVLDQTIVAVLFKDDDATTNVTNCIYAIERKGCSYISGNTSDLDTNIMRNMWTAKSVFAGDPLSRDEMQGNVGANPTEVTNYVIAQENLNLETVSNRYLVTIDYDVVFYELKSFDPS